MEFALEKKFTVQFHCYICQCKNSTDIPVQNVSCSLLPGTFVKQNTKNSWRLSFFFSRIQICHAICPNKRLLRSKLSYILKSVLAQLHVVPGTTLTNF